MYLDRYSLELIRKTGLFASSQNGIVMTSGENPEFRDNRFASSNFTHINSILSRNPKSSDLERILYVFNQVALNHKWPEYGNSDYVYESGLKFNKYIGTEGERFVPRNEAPFNLTGHSINNPFFWNDLSKIYDYFYSVISNNRFSNIVYGTSGINAVTVYGGEHTVLPVSNTPMDHNHKIDLQKIATNMKFSINERGFFEVDLDGEILKGDITYPFGPFDNSRGHIYTYSSYSGAFRNESYNITFNPLASGLDLYSSYNKELIRYPENAVGLSGACDFSIYDGTTYDPFNNAAEVRGETLKSYEVLEHQNFQDQSRMHMLQYADFTTKAIDILLNKNITISESDSFSVSQGIGRINYDAFDFFYSHRVDSTYDTIIGGLTTQDTINKTVSDINAGNINSKLGPINLLPENPFSDNPGSIFSSRLFRSEVKSVTGPLQAPNANVLRTTSFCFMKKHIPISAIKLTSIGDKVIDSNRSIHRMEEYLPWIGTHNLCQIYGLRTEYIEEAKLRIDFEQIKVDGDIHGGIEAGSGDLGIYTIQIANLNKVPDYELVYGYSSVVDGDTYSHIHNDLDNATVIATVTDPRVKNVNDLTIIDPPAITFLNPYIEVFPELQMDFNVNFGNIAEEIPPSGSKYIFFAFRKVGEGREVVPPPDVSSTVYNGITVPGYYLELSPEVHLNPFVQSETNQIAIGPIILKLNKSTQGSWNKNSLNSISFESMNLTDSIYALDENIPNSSFSGIKTLDDFIDLQTYHVEEILTSDSLNLLRSGELDCFKVIDF